MPESDEPVDSRGAVESQGEAEPDTLGATASAVGDEECVTLDIEAAIDLHAFAPRDIPRVVLGYLEAALERGMLEVRLIHGKGKGIQRDRVRRLLAEHAHVVEFFDGDAHRGGWGATVVRLDPAAATNPSNSRRP